MNKQSRKGRNPQTGKEIKIAAKKVPKFTAGAALKEAVSGKMAAKPAKKAAKKPAANRGRNRLVEQAGLRARLFYDHKRPFA